MGKIKGSSAHYINHDSELKTQFVWQRSYGVLSMGQKQLQIAIDYVVNQKEHHKKGTIINRLETDEEEIRKGGNIVRQITNEIHEVNKSYNHLKF